MQLSRDAVTCQFCDIADNVDEGLLNVIEEAEAFSVNFEDYKDNRNVAQLCLSFLTMDNYFNVTAVFLALAGLHGCILFMRYTLLT